MVIVLKMEINNEKENPFLERKEYKLVIDHTGQKTPEKAVLQAYISKNLSVPQEKVDVKNIYTQKGSSMSDVKVFVWKNKTVDVLKTKQQEEAEKETPEKAEKDTKEEDKKETPEEEAPKEESETKDDKKEESAEKDTKKKETPEKEESTEEEKE